MSKITFRADEELVERVEARDASKSQLMREALRAYLDGEDAQRGRETGRDRHAPAESAERPRPTREKTLDAVLAERVDELVAERLAERAPRDRAREHPQNVNVNVTLESDAPARADAEGATRSPADDRTGDEPSEVGVEETACGQCGESLADDHVFCPNCGEKAARRLFCECGDELRSDWGFCPGCGRRTPAADVLDRS
mgnify:CR=1 FL=1